MTAAERYLRLTNAYCDSVGGVRWSSDDDALEYKDGSTFAFTEEVAQFLEGFASCGRLVHFGCMLHLLGMLRNGRGMAGPVIVRLRRAFTDAGRPLRNAGAFCAVLCGEIDEAAGPIDPRDVLDRLRDSSRPIRWYLVQFHDTFESSDLPPPLGPAAFEDEILKRLEAYGDDDLRQWLRHGRGPIHGAGEKLAQMLPPRTLTGALAALLNRPRLVGARAFVTQMQSALALPPRRRLRPRVSLGGYADVTTHGQPHQLLPSQFALDELDFLRRFADQELLYFRREEPHDQTRHELVALLDQGVRTWGDVRLVLGAAVLALGKLAVKCELAFRVTATSAQGDVVDPVETSDASLGELVEASDLSANPGLALERLLEKPATGSRDIVLLTHPRNLLERDVRAAALRASPETRLLALALDGNGRATLSELRHGVPVTLRQFRVDFAASVVPQCRTEPPGQWHGDVEPIGFPFRFGTTDAFGPNMFDFDHDGEWLLTASRDGMLHLWPTDQARRLEVLPRPSIHGRVLSQIDAVLGVTGGFVITGQQGKQHAMAHYDLRRRLCRAQMLGETQVGHVWEGSWHLVGDLTVNKGSLPVVTTSGSDSPTLPGRACHLDADLGQLQLVGVEPRWEAFIPLADGQPVLKGCKLAMAKCRGNTLAVRLYPRTVGLPALLRIFRGPKGIPLAEFQGTDPRYGFALSSDGSKFARQVGGGRIEVRATHGNARPLVRTYGGGFASKVQFLLGDGWLLLAVGPYQRHLIRWDGGLLVPHRTRSRKPLRWMGQLLADEGVNRLLGVGLGDRKNSWQKCQRGGRGGGPAFLQQFSPRFVQSASGSVVAALDRFGQIAILDMKLEPVCMFLAIHDELSGWLADGTCFGTASRKGRPPTMDELRRFGRVLVEASQRGREPSCK